MNIIIPLGGKGERFARQGYAEPKPLIRVLDKPMLCYALDGHGIDWEADLVYIAYDRRLDLHGFRDVVAARYPLARLVALDRETRGAAETVAMCLARMEGASSPAGPPRPTLLLDCDTFYTFDVVQAARDASGANAVFCFHEDDAPAARASASGTPAAAAAQASCPPLYSYVALAGDGRTVTDIAEKRRISSSANTGAYLFRSAAELRAYCELVVATDLRFNGEFYTSCTIKAMLDDGIPFRAVHVPAAGVISLGTPAQMEAYVAGAHAFLFDLDGTLVRTDHVSLRVWRELLVGYHIHLTDELFARYIQGNNDAAAMATLVPAMAPLSPDALAEISRRKDALFLKHVRDVTLVPGARTFIEAAKARGHKVSVVTNCNRTAAEAVLMAFGLQGLVDHLVVGNECARPKPFSDPYLAAIKEYGGGIPHDRCFVFEDSRSGMLSAQGVFPRAIVGISTSLSAEQLLAGCGADLAVASFDELTVDGLLSRGKRSDVAEIEALVASNLAARRVPVSAVRVHGAKLKGGYIADVIRADVELSEPEGAAPLDCVIKLQCVKESPLNAMAYALDLYGREYYFYESVAPYVNVCIPRCHGIIKGADFESRGILLENLDRPGFHLGLDLNVQPVDVTLRVVERIAQLHARFWGRDLGRVFPALMTNDHARFKPAWAAYVASNWPAFEERWRGALTEKQLELGRVVVRRFQAIQDALSRGPLTLTHGDVKSGNIFYRELSPAGRGQGQGQGQAYEPYFLDWQYVGHGKGVQDLVFFLIESFTASSAARIAGLARDYYRVKLEENGVSNYTSEQFDADFQCAICYYPFFVAVWFGVMPEEHLIDLNFPHFFIQRLFAFMEANTSAEFLDGML
jgi:beta-phosphoglucomutase-like phosphatase (HAD superfamily)